MTTSGLPIDQPPVNCGAAGKSLASPSFAPPSIQAVMVSISCCFRRRSLAHSPTCGSACHGVISRLTTFSRIDFAHGRTSLELRTENGADSPGRWHSAQLLKKIGATSLLNVTIFAEDFGPIDWLAGSASKMEPKLISANKTTRDLFMDSIPSCNKMFRFIVMRKICFLSSDEEEAIPTLSQKYDNRHSN